MYTYNIIHNIKVVKLYMQIIKYIYIYYVQYMHMYTYNIIHNIKAVKLYMQIIKYIYILCIF